LIDLLLETEIIRNDIFSVYRCKNRKISYAHTPYKPWRQFIDYVWTGKMHHVCLYEPLRALTAPEDVFLVVRR